MVITPVVRHREVYPDDYGTQQVPAETIYSLAYCFIDMTLVHFDNDVLNACIMESMAGGGAQGIINTIRFGNSILGLLLGGLLGVPQGVSVPKTISAVAGVLAPAGSLMGNGLPAFASGNHYISLNLLSPQLGFPWRFPTSYLTEQPIVIPLGTEKSMVKMRWKAIPYAPTLTLSTASTPDQVYDCSGNIIGSITGITPFNDPNEVVSSGRVLWDHVIQT